jgi:putative tryptophan/tyrosine transport system substrate-binding protein
MQRRQFIKLVGGLAIGWPLTASAQSERIRRVAILMGLAENDPETEQRLAIFKNEMEKLGWSEGRNFRIEVRFAPAGAQASQLAKELTTLQPDVILAHSAQIAGALFQQTREIPVVFVNVSDPIGAGFIVSLARPGGNFTGVLHYEPGIVGKWLAMLKEIAPTVVRVALVGDPKSLVYNYFVRTGQAAGRSLATELVPTPVENAADIERSIEAFAGTPNGGLLLPPDITTITHRDLILAHLRRNIVCRRSIPSAFLSRKAA